MAESSEVIEVYDKRAKIYDSLMNISGYASNINCLINAIPLEIPFKANILDIGCGTGLATEVLLERFSDAEVTGLDYSGEMLDIYVRRFPRVKAIAGDFNQEITLLDPSSFDLIVSTGAVSEYGDLDMIIPLIHRLLREERVFINLGVEKNFLSKITGILWQYKPSGKQDFMSACMNHGFSDVEEIPIPWSRFPSNYLKYAVKAGK
jgi:SAM-dependent methyltransferase